MNRTNILDTVRKDGLALYHADEHMQSDKDIVMESVKQNGYALQYANSFLQKDRKLAIEAVKQNGWALEFVDKCLRSDKELVMEAVKQNGLAIQYADKSLKMDREVVMIALRQNAFVRNHIDFADNPLKKDEAFLLPAIQLYCWLIEFADKSLQLDKNFVLKAMKQNGIAFKYVDPSFMMDEDIISEAIGHGFTAQHLWGDTHRSNSEFMKKFNHIIQWKDLHSKGIYDVFAYGWHINNLLSGKEFNRLFSNEQFRKKIHGNMCMKGFQYKIGVNKDTIPLNTKQCSPGGLYFTTKQYINSFSDYEYGKTVYGVRIPDEAQVFIEGPDKLKADMIEIYSLV